MARVTYRANLSPKVFPFLSREMGRTVIVPQADQNFSRYLSSEVTVDKDIGIPQIFYCHNVLPVDAGITSVGYNVLVNPASGYEFVNAWSVRDNDVDYKLAVSTTGQFFTVKSGELSWTPIDFIAAAAGKEITVATVQGVTYVQIEDSDCYQFCSPTYPAENTPAVYLSKVTLTGLTDGANPVYPKGITTFSGYLVAWTKDAFYWSSTISPTDFTPSLATGAGGGQVESIRGSIIFCSPFASGLYVYTDKNIVSAIYSSNIRYPFTFKEISQAGGISSSVMVATESIVFKPYAYTASGLQEISATVGARPIFPQATDFLSSSLFEDYFDDELKTYEVTDVIKKAVSQISDRYLIISYGVGSLTHALVYDQTLERWGKLKKEHVSVLEWDIIPPEVTETPKNSTALLQKDGTVLLVNQRAPGEGVVFLGKYQYVRARTLQLQEVVAENLAADCKVTCLPSVYGKVLAESPLTLIRQDGEAYTFGSMAVGTNVSLKFEGTFSLTSLVLSFNVHGAM